MTGRKMPDICVVTLDLWQTLIVDKREWGLERARIRIEGTLEVLRRAGELITEEQVWEGYRLCYRTCKTVRQQGLDVSFRDQVQIFVRGISEGLMERINRDTFAAILNRYADSFFESPPAMVAQVPQVLKALKDRNYRIGLISNTGMTPGRLFRSYLEELGIIQFFDHLTFSDEVLLSKPSGPIFMHAMANMGSTASNTVHVGDHLLNDIVGAKDVGMRTIWVEGFDDSEVEVSPTITISHIQDLPDAIERLSVI
jgi:HAD superfamily hydrolase (TIGR01509 family)